MTLDHLLGVVFGLYAIAYVANTVRDWMPAQREKRHRRKVAKLLAEAAACEAEAAAISDAWNRSSRGGDGLPETWVERMTKRQARAAECRKLVHHLLEETP